MMGFGPRPTQKPRFAQGSAAPAQGQCPASGPRQVPVKAGVCGARLIGAGLIVLGLTLFFLAVPFWLWALLLGVVLILAGLLMVNA
jgi:hypothetical protein